MSARHPLIKISKPQLLLYKMIKDKYAEARLNFPIKTPHTTFFVDVALPTKKIAYEYNEPFWHQNKKHELKRQCEIERRGWKIINIDGINKLREFENEFQNNNSKTI